MFQISYFFRVFIFSSLFLILVSFCQQENAVSRCKEMIRDQDHEGLSSLCADHVFYENQEETVSIHKSELIYRLANFFQSHPIQLFHVRHQGGSKDGAKYMIASYKSTKGRSFLLKVKFHKHDGDLRISTIKFSPE